jgi:hypothetical protein
VPRCLHTGIRLWVTTVAKAGVRGRLTCLSGITECDIEIVGGKLSCERNEV